jgi:3-oxoacyl-[acyl-carrier protein] reductase
MHSTFDSKLKGKVAWITGSSRGIGAAIAKTFGSAGAKVALHGRDQAALAKTRAGLEKICEHVAITRCDVTNLVEIEASRNDAEERLGPIDILVTNAGGSFTPPRPLEEIPEEGWRATMDGNLTSTFLTVKSVLPGMKQRRSGNIITLSSTAGHRPHAFAPLPYAAAKAGIEILTKSLAAQVGPSGIRVNGIAPGTVLTERNNERSPQDQKARLIPLHPLGRLGEPDDVAQAALFLASYASAWITGMILEVTGGAFL